MDQDERAASGGLVVSFALFLRRERGQDSGMEPWGDEYFEMLENAPSRTAREIFADRGFFPPSPEELAEGELRGRLWELLYACAAQRFYFYHTDHLDDLEFHHWLHRDWLEEPIDDIPPAMLMNCHIAPDEPFCAGSDNEVWLRFYADEADRAEMAADEPGVPLPPHETPANHRDRFLPVSTPPPTSEIDYESMMDDDPLGLLAVDREILRLRAAEEGRKLPDAPDWEAPAKTLQRTGFTPMPPAEITPEALPALLWELLHELSLVGFYAVGTNHLSDGELYDALWRRGLREDALLVGSGKHAGWFHDLSETEDGGPSTRTAVIDRDWRLPQWRYDVAGNR